VPEVIEPRKYSNFFRKDTKKRRFPVGSFFERENWTRSHCRGKESRARFRQVAIVGKSRSHLQKSRKRLQKIAIVGKKVANAYKKSQLLGKKVVNVGKKSPSLAKSHNCWEKKSQLLEKSRRRSQKSHSCCKKVAIACKNGTTHWYHTVCK
jgi:hypothetical protein